VLRSGMLQCSTVRLCSMLLCSTRWCGRALRNYSLTHCLTVAEIGDVHFTTSALRPSPTVIRPVQSQRRGGYVRRRCRMRTIDFARAILTRFATIKWRRFVVAHSWDRRSYTRQQHSFTSSRIKSDWGHTLLRY